MVKSSYCDGLRMVRHFTSTGYIVSKGRILLHWHPKVEAFLPPGGHVEINEDPVQAVIREVKEETGLLVEIINSELPIKSSYPVQVPPPITIMIEDIVDADGSIHQHIDFIYFCRPITDVILDEGWIWVTQRQIADRVPLKVSETLVVPPPEDVRSLSLRALSLVGDMG